MADSTKARLIDGWWVWNDGSRVRNISGGQQAAPQAGTNPQAGTDPQAGTQTAGQTPQAGAGQQAGNGQPDLAALQAQIASLTEQVTALNGEAGGYRKRLRDVEKERDDLKAAAEAVAAGKQGPDADLDRERKAREKAESERDGLRADLHEERLRNAVISQAATLGVLNPEDAYRLIDRDALVTDDSGKPTNAEDVVKTLIQAKPYLTRASGGTTATGAPTTQNGKQPDLTLEDVRGMSEDQIRQNWEKVRPVLEAQRGH